MCDTYPPMQSLSFTHSILIISIDYVWGLLYYSDANFYTIIVTSHIVPAIGIILGLNALRLCYTHKAVGQAVAWLLWCSLCCINIMAHWIEMVFTEAGVYAFYVGTRIAWAWVLFNWTFARKGSSWMFYPSTLERKS